MDLAVLLGLGLGLSMDALVVAMAEGTFFKTIQMRRVLRIAIVFGGFQGLMPVVGWAAGKSFSQYMKDFDHWVAFAILLLIGGKMIFEELKVNKEQDRQVHSCEKWAILLLMAFATSIDALAVGLTFAFLDIDIFLPVLAIGVLTFLVSGLGVYWGAWIGRKYEKSMGIAGGIVLIAIGAKILTDHLMNGV